MAQCEVCGTEVVQGRGRARRTCSAACRQKAHRQRQAQQVAELRAAARPALALVPLVDPGPAAAADDSPAGRIRDAGAELAATIEAAARHAAGNWSRGSADAMATAVRYEVAQVVAAILASAPEASRDEPSPPTPPQAPATSPEPSRNEPAVKRPARKRLTEKAARAIADTAQLVKDPNHRENHRWNLVAANGTVLGHVEPSYGGTGQSGRNGWKHRGDSTFVGSGPYKTRDEAAVQCALSWIRAATTPARHS